MRICLVNYRYFVSGGPERYLFGVKRLLEERGHEVIPFSIRYRQNEPTPWAQYFVDPIAGDDQVTFHEHGWRPRYVKRSLERAFYSREVYSSLARLIRDTRPDVALVQNYLKKLSPSVLTAFSDHGVPVVVRFSDFALVCPQPNMVRDGHVCEICLHAGYWPSVVHRCVQGSLGASLVNALAMTYAQRRRFFDLPDAFVAPSAIMREKMIEGGLPPAKVHHIPTFVEPQSAPAIEQRRRRICFNGRIDEIKGVRVLLDGFDLLRRRGRDGSHDGLALHIAGDCSDGEGRALQAHARRLGTPGVVFTGPLDKKTLTRLVAESLVCVVPSLCYENTPNALLESLACGTPVVASDQGSMKEIISGTGAGVLVPPGEPAALAAGLEVILGDAAEWVGMSSRAQQLAAERYGADLHLQRLLGVFDQVTETRRRPHRSGSTQVVRSAAK